MCWGPQGSRGHVAVWIFPILKTLRRQELCSHFDATHVWEAKMAEDM